MASRHFSNAAAPPFALSSAAVHFPPGGNEVCGGGAIVAKAIAHSYQPVAAPGFGASSGLRAQPFLSSSRRWNGLVGEVYRVRDVNYVAEYPDHVVSLFLRGPVDLLQRRKGRATQRTMRAGDIIIAPAGEPKLLRHRE